MPSRKGSPMVDFKYDDGGRSVAGYKGETGDCVTRAIAIAVGISYQEAYSLVDEFSAKEQSSKRRKRKSKARTGVHIPTTRRIMKSLGWEWVPTMQIGSGCKVHLKADELPLGPLVVKLSNHCAAVIDGQLRDTYDCSRYGTRCVYGYWKQGN